MEKPSTENYLDHTYICLLAGGTGTRLWPRSRKSSPKQFSSLFHRHTLFQQTIKRVKDLIPLSRVFVITNDNYVEDIQSQEPLIPEENIIGEPEKKNTALAMGVAAAHIHKKDPDAVIINLATDHLINDVDLYQKTLEQAAKVAFQEKLIVTVGIEPKFPHVGLGYIEAGEKMRDVNGAQVYKVNAFKEKPDLKTAKSFLQAGNYYWNANNYVWPSQTILDEFKKLDPDLYKNIDTIYQSIGESDQQEVLKEQYKEARSDSIDYAISEKTDKLVVIPGKFGWSDIGDWQAVYDLSQKDENGNVVISHGQAGSHHSVDTKNTLIHFDDQLIATIGVEDLIIVDTKDALLVCHKDKAEDVKKLVNLLKKQKLNKYT